MTTNERMLAAEVATSIHRFIEESGMDYADAEWTVTESLSRTGYRLPKLVAIQSAYDAMY